MFLKLHSKVWIFGIASFLSACADEKHPVFLDSDCRKQPGGACAIASDGGSFHWDLSQLKAGQEYIIVVYSQAAANFRARQTQHSLKIITDKPSAPISNQEANQIAKVQLRPMNSNVNSLRNIDRNISLPPSSQPSTSSNFAPAQNIGDVFEFYEHTPNEDQKSISKSSTDTYIHSPDGDEITGRRTQTEVFSFLSNVYELRYDQNIFKGRSGALFYSDQSFLQQLDACLKTVMPQVVNYLGTPPFSLNAKNPRIGDERVIINATEFSGQSGSMTSGLFSRRDLFSRRGEQPLKDSNAGEQISVSKRSDYRFACSTSPHEYQHLINAKYKLVAPLPSNGKDDLGAVEAARLQSEFTGIDEANSHIFEGFSGQPNIVSSLVYDYMTNPNGVPFATELTTNEYATLNSRSRGLNVLLMYHAIHLAGGNLNMNDPKTKDFLISRIKSPRIGYQNIADYFHISESDLMKSFFLHFARVSRGLEPASEFIPPLDGTSGINIVSMGSNMNDFTLGPPNIHPLQIAIPILGNTVSALSIPAQSVNLFRYIVPNSSRLGGGIDIQTDGSAFTTFIIPL